MRSAYLCDAIVAGDASLAGLPTVVRYVCIGVVWKCGRDREFFDFQGTFIPPVSGLFVGGLLRLRLVELLLPIPPILFFRQGLLREDYDQE